MRAQPIQSRLPEVGIAGSDGDAQIDRIAGHGTAFSPEAEIEHASRAGLHADPDGTDIPIAACRHIGDPALEDTPQDESAVAGRAATCIVGGIGEHVGPACAGQCLIERIVDATVLFPDAVAHVPDRPAHFLRKISSEDRVAVRDRQCLCTDPGCIAVRKPMCEGDGKHARSPLHLDHSLHELPDGRLVCAPETHHPAIMERHSGTDEPAPRVPADAVKLLGPLGDVCMRIFLEQDNHIGGRKQPLRHVAMQIDLGSNHGIGTRHLPNALQNIAFAIVIVVRHHGPMKEQQNEVERP